MECTTRSQRLNLAVNAQVRVKPGPMLGTLRFSQLCGCFSVAGAFTNQLNNKETEQRRKTGTSIFAVELVFAPALSMNFVAAEVSRRTLSAKEISADSRPRLQFRGTARNLFPGCSIFTFKKNGQSNGKIPGRR
jgi:hypothetical protein